MKLKNGVDLLSTSNHSILSLMLLIKNVAATPSNIPIDKINAPTTPSAANIGVQDPAFGLSFARTTLSLASFK